MLKNIANNRIMTTVIILSIAAFSVFSMACEAETIVKEVEVIKEVPVEKIVEVIKEVPVEKIVEVTVQEAEEENQPKNIGP